jgi:Bacterial Ig-like domain (group 3)
VFVSSATVIITSTDATSGAGIIGYSLGRLFQTYTGPIVFTQPGTYNLEYFSTDKAGNEDRHRVLTVTVKMPSTTTRLNSSANPSPYGASVMLTAQVTAVTGTPSGTVKDGAATLGTASLSGGRAIFTVNGLHAGNHSFGATYNGSTSALPSGSNTVVQTVSQSSSTTSLSLVGKQPGGGQACHLYSNCRLLARRNCRRQRASERWQCADRHNFAQPDNEESHSDHVHLGSR